jgi:hypothetical protein
MKVSISSIFLATYWNSIGIGIQGKKTKKKGSKLDN